jgi:hypothetical protein
MATCSNCSTDAKYRYTISPGLSVDYCATHLPKFLTAQKAAGLLNIPVEQPVEETPTKTTKTSSKKTNASNS